MTLAHSSRAASDDASARALDCLNLFVGDVVGGLGPYLASYLRSCRHWDAAGIGTAISAMGIASILAQTPAGAVVDSSRKKRLMLAAALLVMSLSSAIVVTNAGDYLIVSSQFIFGICAAIAGPCIAAISLGVVGLDRFADRIARNEAFNHAGNVLAAMFAALAGYFISPGAVFLLVAVFGLCSVIATFCIRERDIDHDVSRGLANDSGSHQVSLKKLVLNGNVISFAAAALLFHLANAAMLPLAGQYLSEGNAKEAPVWISACIVAAQIVMIPVAMMAGKLAQTLGRKPVLLLAFAVLPIRGLLYCLGNSPSIVVPVQLLDGIGAGVFGVLCPVVCADLTQRTGHYSAVRGLIFTAQGVGAAFSNILAGWIVKDFGYVAGFSALSTIAICGLLICSFRLPETRTLVSSSQE